MSTVRERVSTANFPRLAQWLVHLAAACWSSCCAVQAAEVESVATQLPAALCWPDVTNTARPWTRWWWLGSAVDDANITRLLEEYHQAGLGGVEITCIYGVRGAEDRELPYLSDNWRSAVRHTLREAKRLGMGVDLPTGSGWRTGGPSVTDADANKAVVIDRQAFVGPSAHRQDFDAKPQALVAFSDTGQMVDLTDRIEQPEELSGGLAVDWKAPEGSWRVYSVSSRWSRDNVKRPAPGGEGKNINPLFRRALTNFLDHFSERIDGLPAAGVRAQFHDSYEYEGNWCDDFFAQFQKRRGYRLQDHLPELNGDGNGDVVARIKHDYRETVSDLILEEFITPWTDWSHQHGMQTRNQSHGSPANWLDLYAACDIPETESFGRLVGGDGHPLVFKFASSAANVAGKPLVSAETATWLDEHFQETLGQIKQMVDRLLLAGVNHIVYHGTAYSPQDAAWPGWLFYASTQINPQNPLWRDLSALNAYVARCQSVLQSTKPDNDILLYWPIHDTWHNARGLRMDFRVHNARGWLFDTPFGRVAQSLDDDGFAFDYISDRQLAELRTDAGKLLTSDGRYSLVIVPPTELMPLATMQKLLELAASGASVTFVEALPAGPPGFQGLNQRDAWQKLIRNVAEKLRDDGSASVGNGLVSIVKLDELPQLAAMPTVRCEFWRQPGRLSYLRRKDDDNQIVYLIKNESEEPLDDWVVPWHVYESAALMDPLNGRVGMAQVEAQQGLPGVERPNARRLRLQLAPGQTILVRTFPKVVEGPAWPYSEPSGTSTPITGQWAVEFIAGGPALPQAAKIDALESWTKFAAPEGERFAGTARYSIKFVPPNGPGAYRLNLGVVADSAEVTLNGKPIATLFAPPYTVDVALAKQNELTIAVTNVAANRIRDLDRRRIEWRIFNDINLVSINYRRFDASNWPIRPAGLLGPVTLETIHSQ